MMFRKHNQVKKWKASFNKRSGKVVDLLGKRAKKHEGVLGVHKNLQCCFSEYKADTSFAVSTRS